MISEEDVEKALDYLRNSAKSYAQAKASARSCEYRLKAVEASEFLQVESGSVDYKKSVARASEAYKQLVKEYEEVELEALTIEAYRQAAALKIGWAQSMIKAHSQGII